MRRDTLRIAGSVLLLCAAAVHAAVVNWTGGANNGLFSDMNNWDSRTAPTEADHLNIGRGATVQLTAPLRVGSLRIFDGATVVVEQTLTFVTGVSIEPAATLTLLSGGLASQTQPTAAAPVPGNPAPSKVYPTVTVSGRLNINSGSITGVEPTAGPTSSPIEPTLVLSVPAGGTVAVSGDRASRLRRVRANVAGAVSVGSPMPLELAFSHVQVQASGVLTLAGAGVALAAPTTATAVNDTASRIETLGRLVCDATALTPALGTETVAQTLGVPLEVAMAARVEFTASPQRTAFFRVTSRLGADGALVLSPNAQLVLTGTAHQLSSTSTLTVPNGAAVYVEGGVTRLLGAINTPAAPTGSLVLRSDATLASTVSLAELFLLGGALSLGAADAGAPAHTAEVHVGAQLYWETGAVTGAGQGPARRLVTGPATSVTIAAGTGTNPGLGAATLSLSSASAIVARGATLELGAGGIVEVQPSAMLTVTSGGRIAGGRDARSGIVVLPGGVVHADATLAGDAVLIEANIKPSDGVVGAAAGATLLITGPATGTGTGAMGQVNEVTLTGDAAFSAWAVQPPGAAVLLTLQGPTGTSSSAGAGVARTAVSIPAQAEGTAGLSVVVRGADAAVAELAQLQLRSVSVADGGRVHLGRGADVAVLDALVLGASGATGTAAAVVEGEATVRARSVSLINGALRPATLIVGAGGLDVRGSAPTAASAGGVLVSTLAENGAAAVGASAAAARALGAHTVRVEDGGVLTLAAGTAVDVTAADAVWHFRPGTGALLASGATLRAAAPRATQGDTYSPLLWLEQAALAFAAPEDGGEATPSRVAMHVRNSGGSISVRDGAVAELGGGVTSEDRYGAPLTDTRVSLAGSRAQLTVAAPAPVTSRLGLVTGPGVLVLAGGMQVVSVAPQAARVLVTAGAEADVRGSGGAAAVTSAVVTPGAAAGLTETSNSGSGSAGVVTLTDAGLPVAATDDGTFVVIPGLNDGTASPPAPPLPTAPVATPGVVPSGVTAPVGATPVPGSCPRQRVMGSDASDVAWGLFAATLFLGLAAVGLATTLGILVPRYQRQIEAMKRSMAQPSVLMGGLAGQEGIAPAARAHARNSPGGHVAAI
jgi:hypothetical protein